MVLGLRDGLRSGDIFVPGSRRYADPSTYLFTAEQWAPRQGDFCKLVGKPAGLLTRSPRVRRSCTPRWQTPRFRSPAWR